jgi:RNA recognition motif-containing protein
MADQEPESLPPLKDFEESLEIIAEAKAHHFPDIAVSASKRLREQCQRLLRHTLNSRLPRTTPAQPPKGFSAPNQIDLMPANLPTLANGSGKGSILPPPSPTSSHGESILPPPSNLSVQGGESAASERLFLSYVPPAFSEKDLADLFAPFGPVKFANIPRDSVSGIRRTYGFVTFEYLADAIRAKEQLKPIQINGKTVHLKFAANNGPTSVLSEDSLSEKQLFITGLPATATHAALKAMFRSYPIAEAKVAFDATGNCKGYGWVNFRNHEEAKLCRDAMNGFLQSNGVKLQVEFSRTTRSLNS